MYVMYFYYVPECIIIIIIIAEAKCDNYPVQMLKVHCHK